MDRKINILLAEDDESLGSLLKEYLVAKGYTTTLIVNGLDVFDALSAIDYDLCILDVMLPGKDGFTIAKEIRDCLPKMPIVFLTAKGLNEDVIEGFKSGADDYIKKPFSMNELVCRLEAILKRTKGEGASQDRRFFQVGNYRFDSINQKLFLDDDCSKLTGKESELLKMLCMHQNGILDRKLALETIWGNSNYFSGRSMDVYISKLRKFLKQDARIRILNMHGKGFKLVVE